MAHYVAHVKVEKVEKSDGPNAKRDMSEVVQFTLKAEELPNLISKLMAHINIIDES